MPRRRWWVSGSAAPWPPVRTDSEVACSSGDGATGQVAPLVGTEELAMGAGCRGAAGEMQARAAGERERVQAGNGDGAV